MNKNKQMRISNKNIDEEGVYVMKDIVSKMRKTTRKGRIFCAKVESQRNVENVKIMLVKRCFCRG